MFFVFIWTNIYRSTWLLSVSDCLQTEQTFNLLTICCLLGSPWDVNTPTKETWLVYLTRLWPNYLQFEHTCWRLLLSPIEGILFVLGRPAGVCIIGRLTTIELTDSSTSQSSGGKQGRWDRTTIVEAYLLCSNRRQIYSRIASYTLNI